MVCDRGQRKCANEVSQFEESRRPVSALIGGRETRGRQNTQRENQVTTGIAKRAAGRDLGDFGPARLRDKERYYLELIILRSKRLALIRCLNRSPIGSSGPRAVSARLFRRF